MNIPIKNVQPKKYYCTFITVLIYSVYPDFVNLQTLNPQFGYLNLYKIIIVIVIIIVIKNRYIVHFNFLDIQKS